MKHKELLFGLLSLILVIFLSGFYLSGKTSTLVVSTPTPISTPAPEITTSEKKDNITKTGCRTDDDCLLINKNLGFDCCWTGTCDPIDYSQEKWIAVNQEWFVNSQEKNCPPPETCGGGRACDPKPINENYEAKCVNRICQKKPIVISNKPDNAICGIENCHGLDIICGSKVPEICTEEYLLGDRCRQFAICEKVGSSCQLVQDPEFTNCKSCVERCQKDFSNGQMELFNCESECGQSSTSR